jgi:hypothetical protein
MRPLVLYLRSRQVPVALAVAAGSVAALWSLSRVTANPDANDMLGLLSIVACAVAAGHGLAGPDSDLDRTAAIAWPVVRTAHIMAVAAVAAGVVAGTALTAEQLASGVEVARDAIGMSGLVALGAAVFGAGRAWTIPATWTGLAWALDVPPGTEDRLFLRMFVWMLEPAGSIPAAITAVALGVAGVLAYGVLGPRPRASNA